ncbi:histidine phosphatase family protein [Eubacteriaceae bacterium ES3]|nr:histidine phosphatase family protein [Eubacteriaceae bacterium ES3]
MKLIVIRHAKVLFEWEKCYTGEAFNRACKGYSEAEIFCDVESDIKTGRRPVFISELKRTEETARMLFGERDFIKNEVFNEVELRSFIESSIKLPTPLLKAMGRTHWFLNITTQPELRKQTTLRAQRAIDLLEAQKEDVILVSHGIFMQVMFAELKKRGYSVRRSGSVWFENLDMIVAEK